MVLSQDEGAVTPQGEMNAGDKLVDKLTSTTSSAGDSPMVVLCVGLMILIIAGLLPIARNRDSR